MALTTRVWSAGKLLVLGAALLLTYLVSAGVAMRVALRAREVQVPNLVNQSASDAATLAADAGLSVHVEDARRLDARVPAGRVVAQDLAPGSTARQQRTVKVWLSAGAHSAMVPTFSGEGERAAQLRAGQSGLTISTVSDIRSAAYPADQVVAQDPPPDTPGPSVALLVNRGERGVSYVMPDLIGVNGERAGDLLRSRGLRVAVVASAPYPGVPAGVVLRQNPQAGFQIGPGEPISLEVSR